ncbi:MAG: UDP-N-acetylglucosamine 2-epimerase [Synergistaceae bacterium]|nr:UDP-N-acetylglucosamine 2-epimerase [Synergistaceae bacterium]
MGKRKVCVVTGTRAEYGLLYWLIRDLESAQDFDLQLMATGMHLSPEFGLTYKVIESDGFAIDARVESLLSSDTPVGIAKSTGLGLIGFADAFGRLAPDIVVVLGDRYEILAAAFAAYIARIPIAHIGGGEVTEGAVDEAIRHMITKMSSLHIVANETYRRRVIQLGEDPESVHVGKNATLEYLDRASSLSREELEASLGFKLGRVNFLVTYHPATLGEDASAGCTELLAALDLFQEAKIVFTYPNSDTDGRVIIGMIEKFVERNIDRAAAFVSLGGARYLGCLAHFDVVIGNSSSGLIEAPTFRIPTVNIGERQRGRLRAASVIDCRPERSDIANAVSRALSPEFAEVTRSAVNPYCDARAPKSAIDILRGADLKGGMKKFFDI